MLSLKDLPFDVVRLITSFGLPYDVVALAFTCRSFLPLLFEKILWLQVADCVSRSWPLPFTAQQARDLPVRELVLKCCRAQRLAMRWGQPNIYPSAEPVKIRFSDSRIVIYFAFLPGSRHLMVQDSHNILTCWTTEGELLDSWQVPYGAKMTRWKPYDDSKCMYNFPKTLGSQVIEIMIQQESQAAPTQYQIVLLCYFRAHGHFHVVNHFTIPRVFEPFSSMSQDELTGSLVKIDILPSRVGIYLFDKTSEKALCFDTGLRLLPDCVPQALLSNSLLILYWETTTSAFFYTYEMSTLRFVLAHEGRSEDDVALCDPVEVKPSDKRILPFRTIHAAVDQDASFIGTCHCCGMRVDGPLPDTDLSNNRNAYPFIIPKWHTWREDLKRHRPRSVLCFSKRSSRAARAQTQALALYVNAPDLDTMHIHLLDETGVLVRDGFGASQDAQGPGPSSSNRYGRTTPLTTITHHYFDYSKATEGGLLELVRTVLADAPLRHPLSLHIHRHNVEDMVMETDEDDEFLDGVIQIDGWGLQNGGQFDGIEEFGDHHFGAEDSGGSAETEQNVGGLALEDMGVVHFDEEHIHEDNHDETGNDDEHNHHDSTESYNHIHSAQIEGSNGFVDIAAIEQGMEGLGLDTDGDQDDGVHDHLHDHGHDQEYRSDPLDLTPEAAQALTNILQDPFGGNPVMGYGGRCAMWVEEHPRQYKRNGKAPVLRVATFPTYEPRAEDRLNTASAHPELEISCGRVGTFQLPHHIALENAYTFDLDDVSGQVGIATLFGELWIVDFS